MKNLLPYIFIFLSFLNTDFLFSQGGDNVASASGSPVTLPFTAAGTTVGKNDNYNSFNTGLNSSYIDGPDWLYYFCATSTTPIIVNIAFTPDAVNGVFPSISVWDGNPTSGATSLLAFNLTVGVDANNLGMTFIPTVGQCYYAMVDNWPLPDGFAYTITIENPPTPPAAVLQPTCSNMGFEDGNFTGWQGSWSNIVEQSAVGSPTPNFTPIYFNTSSAQHTITSGAGLDATTGIPVVCPGQGVHSLKLGDGLIGEKGGATIQQKFTVATSNALFTYNFAVVVEDGSASGGTPHDGTNQPYFKVEIFNSSGAIIPCGQYFVTGGPGIPGFTQIGTSGVYYKGWTPVFVDLTAYIGSFVTVKYTVNDCALGAHSCYAYIDAACAVVSPAVPVNICPGTSTVLTAPAGGLNYSWTVVGSSTFLGASQTLTVSPTNPATYYQCIVNNPAGCPTTLPFTVNVYATPTVTTAPVTICAGSPVNLVATGFDNGVAAGGTYAWSPGGLTGSSISPSPASTTTYTVTYTDPNLCTATATALVTVNAVPVVTVNSPTICPTTNATLTAAGAATYVWNATPTLTANPYIVSPATTTTYTVVGTTLGCIGTATATVTVAGTLVIAVNSPTICVGGTAILTASGGTTYSWDQGATLAVSTVNPYSVSPAVGTTVYTVTGTTNGCSGTATSTVTVNPIPFTTAGSNSPICAGVTLNLTATASATPGVAYSWTGPNGFISAVQNPSITAATTLATGAYTVTISAAGCSTTSVVNVVINPGPITVAGANTPICEGVALNLTATASSVVGTTYDWVGPNSFTSAVQNPTIPATTASATGSYTVTVAAAGCSSTSSVNVVVNPIPTTVASSNSPICAGTSLNLAATASAVAGSTYSWIGVNSFSSALQNPSITGVTTAATGSYTVTVVANGCSSTSLVNVIVHAVPVTVASTAPICLGSDLNLLATASPGATYSWTGPNSFSSSAQNPTIPAATLAASGLYTVTVTANSCFSSSTVNAVVNAPVLPLFPPGASVCEGTIAPVLMTTSFNGFTGSWFPNPVSTSIIGPTTYNFIPNTGQCALPTSVVIIINPVPVLVTSPLDTCSPFTVDLTNSSVTSGSTAGVVLSYWQDPACTIALSGPSAVGVDGTYFIKADLAGCSDVAPVEVVIHSAPLASFTPTPAILSNLSPISTMINTSIGAVSYSWDFGDNQTSIANSPSHYFPDSDSGTYVITLTVTNAFGCVDIAVSTVKVNEELLFYVPNTFTPDSDTYNESFQPIFTSGFDPFDYKLLIFNRWGEVIFESHNTDLGWRGLYGVDGVKVQDGTYTWKIEFTVKSTNKRKVVVGHVNVLR